MRFSPYTQKDATHTPAQTGKGDAQRQQETTPATDIQTLHSLSQIKTNSGISGTSTPALPLRTSESLREGTSPAPENAPEQDTGKVAESPTVEQNGGDPTKNKPSKGSANGASTEEDNRMYSGGTLRTVEVEETLSPQAKRIIKLRNALQDLYQQRLLLEAESQTSATNPAGTYSPTNPPASTGTVSKKIPKKQADIDRQIRKIEKDLAVYIKVLMDGNLEKEVDRQKSVSLSQEIKNYQIPEIVELARALGIKGGRRAYENRVLNPPSIQSDKNGQPTLLSTNTREDARLKAGYIFYLWLDLLYNENLKKAKYHLSPSIPAETAKEETPDPLKEGYQAQAPTSDRVQEGSHTPVHIKLQMAQDEKNTASWQTFLSNSKGIETDDKLQSDFQQFFQQVADYKSIHSTDTPAAPDISVLQSVSTLSAATTDQVLDVLRSQIRLEATENKNPDLLALSERGKVHDQMEKMQQQYEKYNLRKIPNTYYQDKEYDEDFILKTYNDLGVGTGIPLNLFFGKNAQGEYVLTTTYGDKILEQVTTQNEDNELSPEKAETEALKELMDKFDDVKYIPEGFLMYQAPDGTHIKKQFVHPVYTSEIVNYGAIGLTILATLAMAIESGGGTFVIGAEILGGLAAGTGVAAEVFSMYEKSQAGALTDSDIFSGSLNILAGVFSSVKVLAEVTKLRKLSRSTVLIQLESGAGALSDAVSLYQLKESFMDQMAEIEKLPEDERAMEMQKLILMSLIDGSLAANSLHDNAKTYSDLVDLKIAIKDFDSNIENASNAEIQKKLQSNIEDKVITVQPVQESTQTGKTADYQSEAAKLKEDTNKKQTKTTETTTPQTVPPSGTSSKESQQALRTRLEQRIEEIEKEIQGRAEGEKGDRAYSKAIILELDKLSESERLFVIQNLDNITGVGWFPRGDIIEHYAGLFKNAEQGFKDANALATNFTGIDHYKPKIVNGVEVVRGNVYEATEVISDKTATNPNVENFLKSKANQKNLQNLENGLNGGLTKDGVTITYDTPILHVYMSAENLKKASLDSWRKAIDNQYPGLKNKLQIELLPYEAALKTSR